MKSDSESTIDSRCSQGVALEEQVESREHLSDDSYQPPEECDSDDDDDDNHTAQESDNSSEQPMQDRSLSTKLSTEARRLNKRAVDAVTTSSGARRLDKRAKYANAAKRESIPMDKAAAEDKRAKWTECVAAAHLIQDVTRAYLEENETTKADSELYAEWTGRVTQDLAQQNTKVLNYLEAAATSNRAQKRVETVSENIVKLKDYVRSSELEQQSLRERIEKQRQFNDDSRAASRFLNLLDKLRK